MANATIKLLSAEGAPDWAGVLRRRMTLREAGLTCVVSRKAAALDPFSAVSGVGAVWSLAAAIQVQLNAPAVAHRLRARRLRMSRFIADVEDTNLFRSVVLASLSGELSTTFLAPGAFPVFAPLVVASEGIRGTTSTAADPEFSGASFLVLSSGMFRRTRVPDFVTAASPLADMRWFQELGGVADA